MNTSEFLAKLREHDIKLSAREGKLRVNAPKGSLTDELKRELGARKEELLSFLSGDETVRFEPPPLERYEHRGDVPLSFAQQRLWYLQKLEPSMLTYNMWLAPVLFGKLDVEALERALHEITQRHEILRTRIESVGGVPRQVVEEAVDCKVQWLERPPQEEGLTRDQVLRKPLFERLMQPYDVEAGPLIGKPLLMRIEEEEHLLFIPLHHIVFDGLSKAVFYEELATIYEAFVAGQPSPMSELPFQYADFALWQREFFQGPGFEQQLKYWEKTLGTNPPVLELPTDRPRPAEQTHHGAHEWHPLDKGLIDRLANLGKPVGATLFMVLLAGYKALLARHTGQTDLYVGTAMGNRNHAGLEKLIGFFVNTLVLRTDLEGDPTFRELIARVRDTSVGALEHQDMPFQQLVDRVQPQRNLSYTPLFQTMFVLDEDPGGSRDVGGTITLGEFDMGNHSARTDLVLTAYNGRDAFHMWMEYNTDLFDQATVARMLRHLEKLLVAVAENPDLRLSEVPLMDDAERAQVLVEFNRPIADYPRVAMHTQVEAQCDRTPDATAVACPRADDPAQLDTLTYAELDHRANRLAHLLHARGVEPGALVGLCLERSLDMVVAQHAIWKAGAAYVPLDPAFPVDRLAYMVEDAKLAATVTTSDLLDLLPASAKALHLDALADELASMDDARPGLDVGSDALAYVIYTSGSTGKPKGVELMHDSVSNFMASITEEPGFAANERLLAVTTLSFDISVLELVLPLVNGGTVIVCPREISGDGVRLRELLEAHRPTVMQATPATWRLLVSAGWQGTEGLRVFCGGEALPRDLADELVERCPEVWNLYGPTEATIWSTVERIEAGQDGVSIGRPIASTQCYVLDEALQPLPIGVPGELHIAGRGLARGYINRPDLTAERFVPDPFASEPGARMYKTGDLVRRLADGKLQFMQRVDQQVKVRGFRIELGEIEACLRKHPGVRDCAVNLHRKGTDDDRLVAYVVAEVGANTAPEELKAFLEGDLPYYMIPSLFLNLQALPMTANGKLDRRNLPAPDYAAAAAQDFVPPETEMEKGLAAIWTEVLGSDRVGNYDNFFDLGGHSLLSMQVISKVGEILEVRISPRDLMLQNLGQLAGICEERRQSQDPSPASSRA